MKKVIVFQVEGVLVNKYDEKRMDEMGGKKMIREMVGLDMFEKEFVKDVRGKKVIMELGEMIERMRMLEKRFEEEGDVVKRFWMRDIIRRMEEWDERKEKRIEEKRLKYREYSFEKKVIERRGELLDLERICEVVGGKMIFVSEERKSRVDRLLYNNGLRRFVVERNIECVKNEDSSDVVYFDSVEKLKELWSLVGLRRA